jgi:hypothetical protein
MCGDKTGKMLYFEGCASSVNDLLRNKPRCRSSETAWQIPYSGMNNWC